MKTTKTYSESIRDKYLSDVESGNLRGEIYKLTPANIRKLCLNLIIGDLSHSDKTILKIYFKTKDYENIRRDINKYDLERFKPICKFLKKENDSIASHEALELIALLIDFKSRPFSKYRRENIILETGKKIEENKSHTNDISNENDIIYHDKDEKSIVVAKSKNNRFFVWFSNASALSKLKSIVFTIVIFAGITATTIYILKDQTRWMVWQEDHYVEIKLDLQKYDLNQLKAYKEERILSFKQISPDCNTNYFKEDGSENLWYGKNKDGELEYFTDLGLHPETGSTLKKITKHMIKTHICNTY